MLSFLGTFVAEKLSIFLDGETRLVMSGKAEDPAV
jgi:hypothetical protein